MEAKNNVVKKAKKKPAKNAVAKKKKARPIPSQSVGIRMPKTLVARLKRAAKGFRPKKTFNKLVVERLTASQEVNPLLQRSGIKEKAALSKHGLEKAAVYSGTPKKKKTSERGNEKAENFVKSVADVAAAMP